MKFFLAVFLQTFLVLVLIQPAAPAIGAADTLDRQVDVVRAVSLMRHFHPHDAVAAIDFNAVLLEAFELADGTDSDSDFAAGLATLLADLGSDVWHLEPDQSEDLDTAVDCTADDPATRWVHRGFAAAPVGQQSGVYSSRRSTSGQGESEGAVQFSTVMTSLPAESWRGRALRFSGQARVLEDGQAALWVRVDGRGTEPLFFDNMHDRMIEGSEWSEHEIIFEVDEPAQSIVVGAMAMGSADVEFRSLRLEAVDGEDVLLSGLVDWQLLSPRSGHEMTLHEPDDDQLVRLMSQPMEPAVAEIDRWLPADAPSKASLTLTDGSVLQVPLVLCRSQATASEVSLAELTSRFSEPDLGELGAADLARLDVATLWPVMRDFYPYQELVDDWDGILRLALEQAAGVEGRDGHRRLLQGLLVSLEDGHVRVRDRHPDYRVETAWLPIAVEPVNGELVVARQVGADSVRPGDRIVAIDGQPASEWLAFERRHQSGSDHWRTYQALLELKSGPKGQTRQLAVARDGEEQDLALVFGKEQQPMPHAHDPVRELDNGVVYINLDTIDQLGLDEAMPQLLAASGVVFDLRGYPGEVTPPFLGRMMTRDDDWGNWMRPLVAQGPDGDLIEAEQYGWNLPRLAPAIEAPVIFLTDFRAISYSESMLGLVKRHGLATIVGSTTAGSNGNIQFLNLPGQFQVIYTGMRVIGPDDEILQGRGIEPDKRVYSTLDGLAAGRDEVLEAALEMLAGR